MNATAFIADGLDSLGHRLTKAWKVIKVAVRRVIKIVTYVARKIRPWFLKVAAVIVAASLPVVVVVVVAFWP